MKIVADLHMHSNVSQHAYSTLDEMLQHAHAHGFCAAALTDHGPAMPDGAIPLHFLCLRGLPKRIYGMDFYTGVEANIIDYSGTLDIEENLLKQLDFVITSYHIETIIPSKPEDHTAGLIAAAKNPLVHCLGHTGNPVYGCDHANLVLACAENNTLIEINAGSFRVRAGSGKNCRDIALLCKKHGVQVVVNSDAHSCYQVGDHAAAIELLESISFPEELVINSSPQRLKSYFESRLK